MSSAYSASPVQCNGPDACVAGLPTESSCLDDFDAASAAAFAARGIVFSSFASQPRCSFSNPTATLGSGYI